MRALNLAQRLRLFLSLLRRAGRARLAAQGQARTTVITTAEGFRLERRQSAGRCATHRDVLAEIAWEDVVRVVAFRSMRHNPSASARMGGLGGIATLAVASAGMVRTDVNELMTGWSDFVCVAHSKLARRGNCCCSNTCATALQDWLQVLASAEPAIVFDFNQNDQQGARDGAPPGDLAAT